MVVVELRALLIAQLVVALIVVVVAQDGDIVAEAIDERLDQQEMEEKQYEATAGGGVITAVVSGKRELVRVTIDPEAVDPDDVEMLQDMVVAAVNEAMRKAEADSAQNMSKLTGGLNLGGLFG